MVESPGPKPDFIEAAKRQFAQITSEFDKTLEAVKDPEHRRQLTSSYLDLLQKGMAKAQDSVGKYQARLASKSVADQGSAGDAPPPTSGPPAAPEAGSPV